MRQITGPILIGGWLCAAILPTSFVSAQKVPPPKKPVASVAGELIYKAEVDQMLQKVTGGRKVNPAILPWMRAQVLAGIVDRRLVLAYARRTKSGASKMQIDMAVAALKSKLEARHSSLGKFLKDRSMTDAELRRALEWDMTWKKFLAKYITDERLTSYFDSHRREFDGTQISVSHILLRPAPGDRPKAIARLVQQAGTIRNEITSGKITFEDAARKHSAGPSRTGGGQLGFINRHGSMSEGFSRAAFALKAGQVSEPVRTQFGVHLIRCNKIKPGSKKLGQVRTQVEQALAKELMKKLADIERRQRDATIFPNSPSLPKAAALEDWIDRLRRAPREGIRQEAAREIVSTPR